MIGEADECTCEQCSAIETAGAQVDIRERAKADFDAMQQEYRDEFPASLITSERD